MEIDFVLLGLIRMNPKVSGYQLKTIIDKSTGYFFQAHLSQIYPALKRLYKAGWVTFTTIEREGKPNLKLYDITEFGIETLHDWLTEPFGFELSRSNSDKYFLKLIFMGHLEKREVVSYIDAGIAFFSKARKKIATDNLQRETTFIENVDMSARNRYLSIWSNELSFIIKEMDARIEWLKKLKEEL